MASLICVTAMAMTSLSWVSLCLSDINSIANPGIGVAGVGVLLGMVPVIEEVQLLGLVSCFPEEVTSAN